MLKKVFPNFKAARASGRSFAALLLLATVGTGCLSARMSDHASDRLFRAGQYDEAVLKLQEGVKSQGENGRDSLLYLLDLGLALHTAGRLEESNRIFLQAEKIAEIKDYTSLLSESASILTSENVNDYKGEDFEKVLINTYLAMNFALMGDQESALVEARKVNRILHMMVTEGKRGYKQNAFARYLSAILYEAQGEYNDAYVDYKKTFELVPDYPGLGRDLWRMAFQLRMPDQMERWDQQFGLTREDHDEAKKLLPRAGNAEIIVLFENGISPIKKPHPDYHSIPKFYPRFNPVSTAEVELNGQKVASTHVLHDIEQTAIENLDEKYAAIIAKRIAGLVAKTAVAYEVERRTKDPLVGLMARVLLYASDQADVRSWNLLPRDLQVARLVVPPGTHTVRLNPNGGSAIPEKTVQVGKGKKAFVSFRYVPY